MEFKLELNTQSPGSHIVFHTIKFNSFKINIIERFSGKKNLRNNLIEAIFKIRTLDDVLIETREGNARVILKGDQLLEYDNLSKTLSSYEYRNKLVDKHKIEEAYVHFFIQLMVSKYNLS